MLDGVGIHYSNESRREKSDFTLASYFTYILVDDILANPPVHPTYYAENTTRIEYLRHVNAYQISAETPHRLKYCARNNHGKGFYLILALPCIPSVKIQQMEKHGSALDRVSAISYNSVIKSYYNAQKGKWTRNKFVELVNDVCRK